MPTCTQISIEAIAGSATLGTIMLIAGAYTGGAIFLVGAVIGGGILLRQKMKSRAHYYS